MSELNDTHRAVLTAVCDTVVPAISRGDDPDGFWARTASDVGPAGARADARRDARRPRAGLLELLDALGEQGFVRSVAALARADPAQRVRLGPAGRGRHQRAAGDHAVPHLRPARRSAARTRTGRPSATPGRSARRPRPRSRSPRSCPSEDMTLEADVCVVGSGAGGGVIAGTLAGQGLKVVVLEAGRLLHESDFLQLELPGLPGDCTGAAGRRRRPTATSRCRPARRSAAGRRSTGPTACARPTWVREQWAHEHGLEGVDGSDYDRHLDTVLGAHRRSTDRCSDLNRAPAAHEARAPRRSAGVQDGRSATPIPSATPRTPPAYIGFGDQSGAKQSAR